MDRTAHNENEEFDATREFWDRVARDWDLQVGDSGDANRMLNSDPVLWRFLGDVDGKRILDAGCGTGYLSRELVRRGALVVGVDLSVEMIRIAKEKDPDLDFRVGSCSALEGLTDTPFDALVSNYVLMDTPDLEGTIASFFRTLRPGGQAVAVFSHPCFPAGRGRFLDDGTSEYWWEHSYFDRQRNTDPPWGHFTSDFIWYHRPLSDYWKAFLAAGFVVADFEEPRLDPGKAALARDERHANRARTRPYSVAFKLVRP